jgi:fructose-specific phosphotransferase system IIA component
MKLSEILDKACVKVPLEATEKNAAIEELVDLLAQTGRVKDRAGALTAVMAREQVRSTGIGHGLAVPHGKAAGCEGLVMAVGKPAQPIDFASIDSKPVDIIVLLASPPEQSGPHIQTLARISRLMLMEPFRKAVLAARSADELYTVIAENDG